MLLIYYVISLYNSIMKSTYMCFLKDLNENRPRLALILRLTAIVGFLKDLNENRPRLALILRLTAIVGVDMMRLTAIVGVDMKSCQPQLWPLTSVSTPILAGSR